MAPSRSTLGQGHADDLDLAVGSHSITADYGGDTDSRRATSSPAAVSVSQDATQSCCCPGVTRRRKSISLGLKAEIQPSAPGGGVPTGTVTFEMKKNKKK